MIRDALNHGTLFKPIIGAAIQNPTLAEQIAKIYAHAGAPLIDVRGDSQMVLAVKKAIVEVDAVTKVIASVTPSKNDPHFLKALVDQAVCNGCAQCLAVCPHNAICVTGVDKAEIEKENCRGCFHCKDVCPLSAITMDIVENSRSLKEAVSDSLAAGAHSIELHSSGMGANEVQSAIESIAFDIGRINAAGFPISVCVGSMKSSPAEILNVVNMLINNIGCDNFFIQADGETMSETRYGYGLQSLALVSLITGVFPNVRVIASGGTTEKTWKVAKELKIPLAGVGMGLRSYDVIKAFIGNDINDLNGAISAAKNLFCPYETMNNAVQDVTLFKGSAWQTLEV